LKAQDSDFPEERNKRSSRNIPIETLESFLDDGIKTCQITHHCSGISNSGHTPFLL